MRCALFTVAMCFFSISGLFAQTVNGEWYGVGVVKRGGENNSYLSELKIKQNGRKITGQFNYFFRSVEIKTKISGTYDSKSRTLFLNSNPVLNFQARNANGADCPMEGVFTLKVSRVETTLSGQFSSVSDYRLTCPSIDVRFVKSTGEPSQPTPLMAVEKEEDIISAPSAPVKKPEDTTLVFTSELNKRAFDLSPVIDVDADSLKVSLYDNGEVDGDTISVFYNRRLVKLKQMLSAKPITLMLPLDTSINEISMYADNLGKLPPNTALAVIYGGEQRFELAMTSTFIKNATIRFRRKMKVKDEKNIN